jgi:hypothetical protein
MFLKHRAQVYHKNHVSQTHNSKSFLGISVVNGRQLIFTEISKNFYKINFLEGEFNNKRGNDKTHSIFYVYIPSYDYITRCSKNKLEKNIYDITHEMFRKEFA